MLSRHAMAQHVSLAGEVFVAVVALEGQVDAHLFANVTLAARNLRDLLPHRNDHKSDGKG